MAGPSQVPGKPKGDPSPGLSLRLHGPPGVSETSYWDNPCLWTVTRTLTRIMALISDEKRVLSRSQASPRQVPGRAPKHKQVQRQLPGRSQAGLKAASKQVPGRGPKQVPGRSQLGPRQIPSRSQPGLSLRLQGLKKRTTLKSTKKHGRCENDLHKTM